MKLRITPPLHNMSRKEKLHRELQEKVLLFTALQDKLQCVTQIFCNLPRNALVICYVMQVAGKIIIIIIIIVINNNDNNL